MTKYRWYAVWRYDNTKYLHVENGIRGPYAYVGDEPTYFRTKEDCRKCARDDWFRGTWIIKKKED